MERGSTEIAMKKLNIKIFVTLVLISSFGFVHFGQAVNDENPTGQLEGADCNNISGWAYDPDRPNRSISIQILKDGSSIGEWSTDVKRDDINNNLGVNGDHGFNVSTPATFKDGNTHTVSVKALNQEGGSDQIIGGSGRTIQCGSSGGGGSWPPPEGTPDSTVIVTMDKYTCFDLIRREDNRVWSNNCGTSYTATRLSGTYKIDVYLQNGVPPVSVTPADYTFVAPGSTLTFQVKWEGSGGAPVNNPPVGKLGLPDCTEIYGWAYDPDTPSNSISVEIYKDGPAGGGGIKVLTLTTDTYRGDVNATYNISGNHGYQTSTPESLKDGASHTLYAYGIDTSGGRNTLLEGSPQSISCGGKNTGTLTIRSYEKNGQGIRATYVLTRPDGTSFSDSLSGEFSYTQQPTGTWNVRGETLTNYKYPPIVSPGNSQVLNKNQTATWTFTWEPEPKPPTATITCNGSSAATVPYGGSANVVWSSTNADTCNVTPDNWPGLTGNKTVTNITSFKSYKLTCSQN